MTTSAGPRASTAVLATTRVTSRPLPLGLGLRPLEVAIGTPVGRSDARLPAGAAAQGDLRTALTAVLRPALEREPCAVSFSGGRDSAAVLALATHVARSEGLPPPVPVTLRFPEVLGSDESSWQEAVVDHLGLCDRWVRVELTDELDVVGPYARAQAARHGLMWPYNLHFHQPVLERVTGGALLTGIGGDEVLLPADAARSNQLVAARDWRGLTARDLAQRTVRRAPRRVARAFARRRRLTPVPWLRPHARASHRRAVAEQRAGEPLGWASWVRSYWWPLRFRELAWEAFAVVAAPHEVAVAHPLSSRPVLEALSAIGGERGFATRTDAMRVLVGDLLPDEVIARQDKARFDEVFYNRHAIAAARAWDGTGLDTTWLDHAALRLQLPAVSTPSARRGCDNRAWMLLQALVLTGHARRPGTTPP